MRPALTVARLVLLEARRERTVGAMAGLSCVAMALIYIFSQLALGETRRVLTDLGLGMGTLLGIPLLILVATTLRHREETEGGLDLILARPVGRGSFLMGKFVALSCLMLLWIALTTGLVTVALLLAGGPVDGGALLQAGFLVWLKLEILAAVAILIGTLTSPMLAGFLTLAVALVGHTAGDLQGLLPLVPGAWAGEVVRGLLLALPRLDLYGVALPLALGQSVPGPLWVWATSYAALYSAAALSLAALRMETTDVPTWQ
jgi:ABC-type transport system involved in multi-copper enzyme maturation permease subunit